MQKPARIIEVSVRHAIVLPLATLTLFGVGELPEYVTPLTVNVSK
jgi:hypothetical protein